MTQEVLDHYHRRMQRVLDHIESHLDEDLTLDRLSRIAAFSKHHFHRQFSALVGLSVHRYVQLARLKRASYQLVFRDDSSVTDIAFDAGYEAPEAFARAFRQRIGHLPSSFRIDPDWEPWLSALEPYEDARIKIMKPNFSKHDVTIVDMPATPVAIMEHRGSPQNVYATIRRFIAWRKANGLPPHTHATYNIFHNDPSTTSPADYRVDLCVATGLDFKGSDGAVVTGLIPGGRCARLRVTGNPDNMERPAMFLYREWLPGSGAELRDFPLFCQRVSFFPDVPEHAAITDLFLPLQ